MTEERKDCETKLYALRLIVLSKDDSDKISMHVFCNWVDYQLSVPLSGNC